MPTTLEAGYPDSDYALWLGVFVPAKTPRAIVDRLHDESVKALAAPALRERLAGPRRRADADDHRRSSTRFIKDEIVAKAALAKAAGLKPN